MRLNDDKLWQHKRSSTYDGSVWRNKDPKSVRKIFKKMKEGYMISHRGMYTHNNANITPNTVYIRNVHMNKLGERYERIEKIGGGDLSVQLRRT